jgi:hypothetical protein
MIPIVFGYPSPEAFAAADRGQVAIGGCVITGEDPSHRCAACSEDVIVGVANTCVSCGFQLGNDPDDDPTDAGGPICGECNRARNFDLDEELA